MSLSTNKCITILSTSEAIINADYLNDIYDNIYTNVKMKSWNKLEKVNSETMMIPRFNEFNMMLKYNYNVQQLKTIVSHYKLKIGGNKSQLVTRIFSFLYLSPYVLMILIIICSELTSG
jgi:hypothetical protein